MSHLEGTRHRLARSYATEAEREKDTRVLEAARAQLESNTKQPRTRAKARGGASRPTTTDLAATGERDQPNARQQRLLGKRVKTEPTDSDNDAQHDREHEHKIKHERLDDLKKEEKDEEEEEEEEKEEDEEGVDEEETEDEETEDECDQGVDDSSSNDEAEEEEEEGAERKTKRRRTENSTSGDGAKGGGDRGAVPDGLVLREVKLEKASESDAEEPRMDHYYAEAVGNKGEDKRATQGTETERELDKEASVKMDHDQPATTTTTTNTTGSHDQPQQAEALFDRALPVDAFLELMGLQ